MDEKEVIAQYLPAIPYVPVSADVLDSDTSLIQQAAETQRAEREYREAQMDLERLYKQLCRLLPDTAVCSRYKTILGQLVAGRAIDQTSLATQFHVHRTTICRDLEMLDVLIQVLADFYEEFCLSLPSDQQAFVRRVAKDDALEKIMADMHLNLTKVMELQRSIRQKLQSFIAQHRRENP